MDITKYTARHEIPGNTRTGKTKGNSHKLPERKPIKMTLNL